MELKPGYKQTEVGVIPEDWKCVPAGEAIRFFGGNGFSSRAETTTGIRWLKIANVGVDKIKWDALSYLPDSFLKEYKDYLLKVNDVVMALTRPVLNNKLKVARLTVEDEPAFLNQRVAKLIPINGNKLEYLFYVVQRSNFVAAMNLAMAGTDPPNIGNAALEKIAIAIPPKKEEQTAIANALSDADALIQSLTRLIAKKRQIKQGAMQTLLNPYENGRLKAGWVVKRLGEITDLLTGFPFSSLGYMNEGIRLLRGSNIKRGQTDWNDEITKCWPSMTSDIRRYELLEGDIVVAMDGSLVGRSFAQLQQSDLPALLLQRVARIRSKSESFDINYIKEWVCSEVFTKHCDSLKTVTAIPHISPADIHNFVLNIPEQKEEQIRIATILSDMDAEIAALETKLAKYRHIKQGMMQNLLTGRIRLI